MLLAYTHTDIMPSLTSESDQDRHSLILKELPNLAQRETNSRLIIMRTSVVFVNITEK